MPTCESICIYCGTSFNPALGEGDHVMPAVLGRFRDELVFRGGCAGCNSKAGRLEEQIHRCAPESLCLRIVNPPIKRRKRGRKWVGAGGMPIPTLTIDCGDHRELADPAPDNPTSARPVDQLIVARPGEPDRHIRLHPRMNTTQLRAAMCFAKYAPPDSIRLKADKDTWPTYVGLLKELSFSVIREDEPREAGQASVRGRMGFTFGLDYFRALAKIAFHYYLLQNRRSLRGNEPMFEPLRRFIREGGDPRPFFCPPRVTFGLPFGVLPDGRAVLPPQWSHLLAAEEVEHTAVVAMALFVGPRSPPNVRYVTLGRFPTRIIMPRAVVCHVYHYYPSGTDPQYAGYVVSGSPVPLN